MPSPKKSHLWPILIACVLLGGVAFGASVIMKNRSQKEYETVNPPAPTPGPTGKRKKYRLLKKAQSQMLGEEIAEKIKSGVDPAVLETYFTECLGLQRESLVQVYWYASRALAGMKVAPDLMQALRNYTLPQAKKVAKTLAIIVKKPYQAGQKGPETPWYSKIPYLSSLVNRG